MRRRSYTAGDFDEKERRREGNPAPANSVQFERWSFPWSNDSARGQWTRRRARSGNCLFCEPPGEPPGEPAVMVLFLVIFRVISSRASASAKACDLDSNGRRTAPIGEKAHRSS